MVSTMHHALVPSGLSTDVLRPQIDNFDSRAECHMHTLNAVCRSGNEPMHACIGDLNPHAQNLERWHACSFAVLIDQSHFSIHAFI